MPSPPLNFFVLLLLVLLSALLLPSAAKDGQSNSPTIVSEGLYDSLFLHKDDAACPAKGFYPYAAFIEATKRFPTFGRVGGTSAIQRREVAAFLAQISHETTGGWLTAPDGPYPWGLCFKEEVSPQSDYCVSTSTRWPCAPWKSYKGRGPIQLSWNYNYGPACEALGFDGLGNPDIVANDPIVAFESPLWFWMTSRPPKPSCHDVMVGRFRPSAADIAANRTAGFGLVTNIINGGLECGRPGNAQVNDRIGYYNRYAQMFDVDVGPNPPISSHTSSR